MIVPPRQNDAPPEIDLPPENIYAHTKKLRFILAELARLRAARGTVRILDFGCGNGEAVSRYLIGPGIRYYGVDIHPPSLEHARARFGNHDATFHDRVPEDVTFDLAVYADVLEHLPAPARVLRSHAPLLARGGTLVGAVPNGYGPFEMEHRLIRQPGVKRAIRLAGRALHGRRPLGAFESAGLPYNHESGHLQFFTRRTLRAVIEEGGFVLERLGNGSFVGAPLSERFLLRGERIARLNAAVADFLPGGAVSSWYFSARRRD